MFRQHLGDQRRVIDNIGERIIGIKGNGQDADIEIGQGQLGLGHGQIVCQGPGHDRRIIIGLGNGAVKRDGQNGNKLIVQCLLGLGHGQIVHQNLIQCHCRAAGFGVRGFRQIRDGLAGQGILIIQVGQYAVGHLAHRIAKRQGSVFRILGVPGRDRGRIIRLDLGRMSYAAADSAGAGQKSDSIDMRRLPLGQKGLGRGDIACVLVQRVLGVGQISRTKT